MKRFFYARLALQNIRRNHRFYYPYLLTGALTVAMFYNMIFTSTNPSIRADSATLASLLASGTVIVGIFAVVFLSYTNVFLMKRRQKELGLYNLLGMEKRHIGRILLWEMIYTCIITIGSGLIVGILFSKLMMLVIYKVLFFTVHYGFSISPTAILVTVVLFCAIYLVSLWDNLYRMRKAKPIELLHGGETGEREPKAKAALVIIGILTLGAGYVLAITTTEPLWVVVNFFIAVLLVMVGTYCLFTAGSIALLKLLRRNKHYYYQTRHFTGVSGMLYRMKQNAVGLANICILSTMVLVTISVTVSMYIGAEDMLTNLYPHDVELNVHLNDNVGADTTDFRQDVLEIVEAHGLTVSDEACYGYSVIRAWQEDARFVHHGGGYSNSHLCIVTAEDYNALTGTDCMLGEDEVLMYRCSGEQAGWESVNVLGQEFRVKEWLSSFPTYGELSVYMEDAYVVVVPDIKTYNALRIREEKPRAMWAMYFDLSGTDAEKRSCYEEIKTLAGDEYTVTAANAAGEAGEGTYYLSTYSSRVTAQDDYYALYGGLLFLGIFLGSLFLMATVLIIYYKQVSEGYEDKERFEIMQKVGMGHAEVRATIRSQILIVFFLPLVTAFIHLAMSFPLTMRLLSMLRLTNVWLFALCTLATLAVFALVYAAVYAITARTYYKIVEA